jgi:UDP-N-acetylglucosamine 1-carboxyvinyltransferase
MSTLIIQGGYPISGVHVVPGNKNAALPMLAATLLASEPVTLTNLPNIADVGVMIQGLEAMGAKVTYDPEAHTAEIDPRMLKKELDIPADICSKIRTSFLYVAPGLARRKKIRLRAAPGGDSIGRRRLDTHIHGFEAMGVRASFWKQGGCTLSATHLHGGFFMLDEASVMATENLLMLAAAIDGETILYNTACEPHVQNLCHMLTAMGAKIDGIGTNRLVIHGASTLRGGTFRVGSDTIEAASYMIAALVTKGALTLKHIAPEDFAVLTAVFKKFGVRWTIDGDTLHLPAKQNLHTAYDLGAAIPKIEDGPWPMTPSDLLSVLIVLATQTRGTELFFEKMFESRLYFVDHLIGMGAKIVQCDPHRAVVTGPTDLQGGIVTSPDIRAGMALIIAALCAKGKTIIHNAQSIDRGYESIEAHLKALGAHIERA